MPHHPSVYLLTNHLKDKLDTWTCPYGIYVNMYECINVLMTPELGICKDRVKTRQSAQWGTYTPDQRYRHFLKSTKYVQYSLRVSSTVLASRMNFFNFPRFYYVVFEFCVNFARILCEYFAWSFFLHARDFFSVVRGFCAWTGVSAHELMFRHMIR